MRLTIVTHLSISHVLLALLLCPAANATRILEPMFFHAERPGASIESGPISLPLLPGISGAVQFVGGSTGTTSVDFPSFLGIQFNNVASPSDIINLSQTGVKTSIAGCCTPVFEFDRGSTNSSIGVDIKTSVSILGIKIPVETFDRKLDIDTHFTPSIGVTAVGTDRIEGITIPPITLPVPTIVLTLGVKQEFEFSTSALTGSIVARSIDHPEPEPRSFPFTILPGTSATGGPVFGSFDNKVPVNLPSGTWEMNIRDLRLQNLVHNSFFMTVGAKIDNPFFIPDKPLGTFSNIPILSRSFSLDFGPLSLPSFRYVVASPEPTSFLIMILGFALLIVFGKWNKRRV